MAKKKKGMTKTMPMRVLEEKGISYEPRQQSSKQYTAEGVAEDLGVSVAQVVKAMIVHCPAREGRGRDQPFALFVVPGDRRLSLKKVGTTLGEKNVEMATERDVQRVTGYQVGAVSVLGFRRDDVREFVDRKVLDLGQIIISAGRPDVGLALAPNDMLRAMDGAELGDFCEDE